MTEHDVAVTASETNITVNAPDVSTVIAVTAAGSANITLAPSDAAVGVSAGAVYEVLVDVFPGGCGGGGASSMDDLTDADTSTTPPAGGDVLAWDGSNWVPATPPAGSTLPAAGAGLTGGVVSYDVVASDGTITVAPDGIKAAVGTAAGSVAAGDHLHTGVYDPAGTAAAGDAAHVAAADPHPQYATDTALADGLVLKEDVGVAASLDASHVADANPHAQYVLAAGDTMTGTLFFTDAALNTGAVSMQPDPINPGSAALEMRSGDGVILRGPYMVLDTQSPVLTMSGSALGSPLVVAGYDSLGGALLGWGQPPDLGLSIEGTVTADVVIKAAGGAVPGPWVDLGMSLLVPEDVLAGSGVLHFQMTLANSSNRSGVVEFGALVNGAQPFARDVTITLPANFAQSVAVSVITGRDIAANDTISLVARGLEQTHVQWEARMTSAEPAVFGLRVNATGGSVVTDHGGLTGLADPDHPIAAVQGLQVALDGKETAGAAAAGDAAHAAAVDPHPQYVLVAGDTMTGPLVLPADPAADLQAATKQYVDMKIRSTGQGVWTYQGSGQGDPGVGGYQLDQAGNDWTFSLSSTDADGKTRSLAVLLPGDTLTVASEGVPASSFARFVIVSDVVLNTGWASILCARTDTVGSQTPPAVGTRMRLIGTYSSGGGLTVAEADSRYVDVAGDVMTGALVLPGDAVGVLDAVPRQQLDAGLVLKADAGHSHVGAVSVFSQVLDLSDGVARTVVHGLGTGAVAVQCWAAGAVRFLEVGVVDADSVTVRGGPDPVLVSVLVVVMGG